MQRSRGEVLAWEKRWSLPAAIAAFAAIGFIVAAIVLAAKGVGHGDGEAELLRNVDAHRSRRADLEHPAGDRGRAAVAAPLYYLFRAVARARSEKVRGQLVGVVVAAPLLPDGCWRSLSGLTTIARRPLTSSTTTCPGSSPTGSRMTSDRAEQAPPATAIAEAPPLRSLARRLRDRRPARLPGSRWVCTSLHATLTGPLTRFWGSMGMALGAVSFIFFQFTLLWFVYLGLLLAGRVPGGRPPAWESGEAEPWPTPGDKGPPTLDAARGSSEPTAEPVRADDPGGRARPAEEEQAPRLDPRPGA